MLLPDTWAKAPENTAVPASTAMLLCDMSRRAVWGDTPYEKLAFPGTVTLGSLAVPASNRRGDPFPLFDCTNESLILTSRFPLDPTPAYVIEFCRKVTSLTNGAAPSAATIPRLFPLSLAYSTIACSMMDPDV